MGTCVICQEPFEIDEEIIMVNRTTKGPYGPWPDVGTRSTSYIHLYHLTLLLGIEE